MLKSKRTWNRAGENVQVPVVFEVYDEAKKKMQLLYGHCKEKDMFKDDVVRGKPDYLRCKINC